MHDFLLAAAANLPAEALTGPWWTHPSAWIALLTLVALEIVLGIDNIIFISILAGKLPKEQQAKARNIGLAVALLTRIALLFSLSFIIRMTAPLFTIPLFLHTVSGRDLVLIVGGLFLLAKSTHEIHSKLEGDSHQIGGPGRAAPSFNFIIIQIALLDIVFSLDSVITAVGMAQQIEIMIIAVVISAVFMLAAAGPVSAFVDRHPTVKMLALSFLLLIGFTLVADGFGQHINKGYIYFAMGFSVLVEMLNLRLHKKSAPGHPPHEPVKLTPKYLPNPSDTP